MLRFLALIGVFSVGLCAAPPLWPERLGRFERKSVAPQARESGENGLEASETADYGAFRVTAARFKDSTGAFAASLEDASLRVGNYAVACRGKCPKDLAVLAAKALPGVSGSAIPTLPGYLPDAKKIPRSERYILGPVGLKTFSPDIPAGPAAFQLGAEGAAARYQTPQGEQTLVIFSYPTPGMARQQAAAFAQSPNLEVKRSGPLVAVAPAAPNRAFAQQLLSDLHWQASVASNQPIPVPVTPQGVAQMILAILTLSGIIVGFCVFSGLAFGGFRVLSRKFGPPDATGSMILLRLSGK
jgi:hypothetical protein